MRKESARFITIFILVLTYASISCLPLPTQSASSRICQFGSPASLTGEIYDRGIDTDADQLFNFLEVGVEVNVTEAGTYQISVGGLEGETGESNKTSDIYYDGKPFDDYLDIGIHIINL